MHGDVNIGPKALLDPGLDPAPVERVNGDATHPLLLICEHAGRAIPAACGTLGLTADVLDMHIAYDIGAEQVARRLANAFGCTLVLQRYSRLVYDCNRPPGSPAAIPAVSDCIEIPGNRTLGQAEAARRTEEIFAPFAAQSLVAIGQPHIAGAVSIHSFTRQLQGQAPRPWDIGFLYRRAQSRGDDLVRCCQQNWPELTVGRNEPYQISDDSDWFIPVCAEPRRVPHALIEIRNDQIDTEAGQALWADRLYHLLTEFMDRNHV